MLIKIYLGPTFLIQVKITGLSGCFFFLQKDYKQKSECLNRKQYII